jgi:hypothetical protein
MWDEVAYLNVVFFEEEDDSNVVLERNYVILERLREGGMSVSTLVMHEGCSSIDRWS